MTLSDQQVKDLYLSSPYNKGELHVLKGIPHSQINRALKGIAKPRVWKSTPSLEDRLANIDLRVQDINFGNEEA